MILLAVNTTTKAKYLAKAVIGFDRVAKESYYSYLDLPHYKLEFSNIKDIKAFNKQHKQLFQQTDILHMGEAFKRALPELFI